MYTPNDILIRKTTDGDTLWVSQRLVLERCNVAEEHLRTVARNRYKQSLPASWAKVAENGEFFLGDSGKSWRWGRKAGLYYYDYDRIPDRAPKNYRSQLPSRAELIDTVEQNNLRGSRERDTQLRNRLIEAAQELENADDVRWIQTHSGFLVDIATARDYGRALAWCRMIRRTVDGKQTDTFGAPTVAAFYDLCAEAIAGQRIKNLRTTTVQSLRNKVASMPTDPDEQLRWIVSGKYGNTNRQIVGKLQLVDPDTGVLYPFDLHQAVMYAAYMNFDGPQKEQLNALYDDVYRPTIVDFGLTPVGYRTFCNHLSRFSARLLNDRQRHGDEYYKKRLLTYVPAEKLAYSHSLLCGDGSGLIAYRYRGASGELKYMNLYAMLISDVASGCIVGWSFAPEGAHIETPAMVRQAVQMAVRRGGNQTMFEFVSDNHGAFTKAESEAWLRNVFNRVRTIAPHNSQANPAETQFRLFKATLRNLKNFVRSSHNVGVDGQANLDKVGTYEYPTYTEAIAQLEKRIALWNSTQRPGADQTPAERFDTRKNPECRPMDPIQARLIFGRTTPKEVTEGRGFISVGPKGKEQKYEIPDYTTTGAELIARATGYGYYATVKVVYDETGADLYSADGKFIVTCPPTRKALQSHAEKTEAHKEAERVLKRRKEQQLETVLQHEQNVSEAVRLIEQRSYEEEMHFGGSKESLNGHYEELIGATVASALVKRTEKTKAALERKEAKEATKAEAAEVASLRARHSALRDKLLPELYK